MFDTKVAIVVRDDLPVWKKLNVTAFLATGMAGAAPESLGEPYLDAAGRAHAAMSVQPVLIFAADRAGLQAAHGRAWSRSLAVAAYVEAMFATGFDAANRAAFAAEPADDLDLVGLAVRGPKKDVDKALKGLKLHA